jgi:hypothetical protein
VLEYKKENREMKNLFVLLSILAVLVSCVDMPKLATSKEEQEAKQTKPKDDSANVFIYCRSSADWSIGATIQVTDVNGVSYAFSLFSGMFYVIKDVPPGKYDITVDPVEKTVVSYAQYGHDRHYSISGTSRTIEVDKNVNYYVAISCKGTSFKPQFLDPFLFGATWQVDQKEEKVWKSETSTFRLISEETVTKASNSLLPTPSKALDFFQLVKTGTPQSVGALIDKGADVNARDERAHSTPLMVAAKYNPNPDVVIALLKAGSKVDAKDRNGATALMYAATGNQSSFVIDALIEAGAQVNARNTDGDTALTLAAAYNHNQEVIAALLKAGADIDSQDKSGSTALMVAVEYSGSPETIVVLLEAGANAKARDKTGKTAFDYAQGNEKLKGTDAYRQLQEASK